MLPFAIHYIALNLHKHLSHTKSINSRIFRCKKKDPERGDIKKSKKRETKEINLTSSPIILNSQHSSIKINTCIVALSTF